MKRSFFGISVLVCTLLGAAAGVFLRVYQLTRCMDENGLLIFGSRIPLVLIAFSVLLIVALALLCSRLSKLPGDSRYFSSSLLPMFLSALASGMLLFGCFIRVTAPDTSLALRLLFGGGVLAGILLFIAALLRYNEKKVPFVLLCLPVIFLVAKLIVDFKDWSHDPAVIDFAFLLLAAICAMLSLFNLSGFSLKIGKRRTTVFLCMLTAVFSAITLSDHLIPGAEPDLSVLLINAGLGLWCLTRGVQLLLPDLLNRPAEAAQAEDLSAPEASAEPVAPAEAEAFAEPKAPAEPEVITEAPAEPTGNTGK